MDMDMDMLDEVYERMHRTGPEFGGWLSNHGPMAGDALLRMGAVDGAGVHRWLDQYRTRLEEAPGSRWVIDPADWREPLGDARRLGDWTALMHRELGAAPWRDVLVRWWPRLLPGSVASATHPLIRTGHAVRALEGDVTPARVAELAQALGYWAARWQPVPGDTPPRGDLSPGEALDALPEPETSDGGVRTRIARLAGRAQWSPALAGLSAPVTAEVPAALTALVDAAITRYARWAPGSPIMLVHAATAPRAALLVLPSLPRELWVPTHAAAWVASATISTVYRPSAELPDPADDVDEGTLLQAVLDSGDEHVVKFAETCLEASARGLPLARATAARAAALIDAS